jgi:hypothetical protein
MIKLILKANNWYDSIKEPNRTIFFFSIMIPVIISQYFLTKLLGNVGYIYWALFMLIFVIFRMIPSIVGIIDINKSKKNSEKNSENKN